MTVNIASEMPFNPSRSLILLDCVLYLDILRFRHLSGSAIQCILGKMYLRSDLSRKVQLCVHVHHYSKQFVHDFSCTSVASSLIEFEVLLMSVY